MRVLVTGATGFIGGRLTERLLEQGDTVRMLVRRPDAARRLLALGAEVSLGDLTDPASLARAVAEIDVVYHCAGLATDWAALSEFEQVNVEGARALAQAAARSGSVTRFVHLSTTDVYGYPALACADDGPTRDVGLPYNRSKLRGEAAVRAVAAETGLPLTVLRPGTVYGPRSKDWGVEMAKLLAGKDMLVIAGGQVPAGLIYVDNLVDAMLAAATRPAAIGRVYTLRDVTTETWRTYLDRLADGLGFPRVQRSLPFWLAMGLGAVSEAAWRLARARSRPLITRHAVQILAKDQCYGIDRAVAELGFASRVSFDEGLRRTVAWLETPEGRAARGIAPLTS